MSAVDLYPSRIGGEARVLIRKDPVVHASDAVREHGPLSNAALSHYERKGFLLLDPFLTPEEIEPLAKEATRLARIRRNDASGRIIREPGDDEVRSIFGTHEDAGVFSDLVRSAKVRTLADQLLGSGWYIHQSRINYKPAFRGRAFHWHSDFETWHVEDGMPYMRAFSLSINLTENRPDNGPLMLIPESHHAYVSCPGKTPDAHFERSLQRQEAGIAPEFIVESLVSKHGIESPIGAAGSAILFDCNLLHGSNGNITPYPRTNFFIVFNRLDNALADIPFSGQPPRPQYIANRKTKSPS